VSYSWYLWHWPVLVLVNARWGEASGLGADGAAPHVGALGTAAAVVVSFGLAVASHYLVEQPVRRAHRLQASRPWTFALGAGLVSLALVSATGLALPAASGPTVKAAKEAAAQPADKLAGLKGCYNDFTTTTVPPAEACRLGPEHGTRSVVLIGDSHSQHWMPALARLADERGWTVYTFAKSSCPVVDARVWLSPEKHEYTSCATWRKAMLARLGTMRVDAVLIGRWMDYRELVLAEDGSRVPAGDVEQPWRNASEAAFARLGATAPRILVIRDTPRPKGVVPACISRHDGDDGACAFDKASRTHLDDVLVRAERAADPERVRFVDLTDRLCPDATCPVVEDGTLMYRDAHHLTVNYAAELADPFGDAIEAQLR
jgi:hypothetical protein